MDYGKIWWGQLGCSLRLLDNLTNLWQDCRSAVLQTGPIPWRRQLLQEVNLRRSAFSASRRLVELSWGGENLPGEAVLREFCSQEVVAGYWPGKSYAVYLAELENLLLHDQDIWVRGIHNEESLRAWWSFVSEYERCREGKPHRATFLLEYGGPEASLSGAKLLSFRIESHNCRVFCLEAAGEEALLPDYRAELALSIGGTNPEFCAALLQTGDALLLDPPAAARDVMECDHDSAGNAFPLLSEAELESRIWKAALVLLFPILERFRMDFIRTYRTDLLPRLPHRNSFGAIIREADDLELADLWSIISNNKCHIPPQDYHTVKRFTQVRHCLAHIKPVKLEDVQAVLERS